MPKPVFPKFAFPAEGFSLWHRAHPKLFKMIGNPVVKETFADTQLALNQARSDLWAARARLWYYRFAGFGQRWDAAKLEFAIVQDMIIKKKGEGINWGKSAAFVAECFLVFYMGELASKIKISGVAGYPNSPMHPYSIAHAH